MSVLDSQGLSKHLFLALAVVVSGCIGMGIVEVGADTYVNKDAEIDRMEIEIVLLDEANEKLEKHPTKTVEDQLIELIDDSNKGYIEYSNYDVNEGMVDGNHSYTFTLKGVEVPSDSPLEVYEEDEYVVYKGDGRLVSSDMFPMEHRVHMPGSIVETSGEKVGGNTVRFRNFDSDNEVKEVDRIYVKSEKSSGILNSILSIFAGLF